MVIIGDTEDWNQAKVRSKAKGCHQGHVQVQAEGKLSLGDSEPGL